MCQEYRHGTVSNNDIFQEEEDELISSRLENAQLADGVAEHQMIIDLLEQRFAEKKYMITTDLGKESIQIHVPKAKLEKITGLQDLDIDLLQRLFIVKFPTKQLQVEKNVSKSVSEKYKVTGKQAVAYFILGVPWVIPGLMYLHQVCQGYMFTITETVL